MTKQVLEIDALPEFILTNFGTTKVLVYQGDRILTIEPISTEMPDCTAGLRGILSDYPEMSVDKFLERKRSESEFDF
jgi:virulence-associated protein VagC